MPTSHEVFFEVHYTPVTLKTVCNLICMFSGQLTVGCNRDLDTFWVQFPPLKPSSSPDTLLDIQTLEDCQEACRSRFKRCTAVDFMPDQWCKMYEREKIARYENATAITTSTTTMYLQVCLTGKSVEQ